MPNQPTNPDSEILGRPNMTKVWQQEKDQMGGFKEWDDKTKQPEQVSQESKELD